MTTNDSMTTTDPVTTTDSMTTDAPPATPLRPAADEAALLQWRTRDTTRHLAQGTLGALAIALVTGIALWSPLGHGNLVQLLLVHLTAGLLGTLLFVPFIVIHWRDGKEPLSHLLWPFRLLAGWQVDPHARKRLVGHFFLWFVILMTISGLIIAAPAIAYLAGVPETLPYGGHAPLLAIHRWLTPFLLAGLFWHLPKEERA